jgi:hypothetical protein
MSFEDRLKNLMKSADSDLPGPPMPWTTTIERAKKRHRLQVIRAVAAAAAVVVLVVTGVVLVLQQDDGPEGLSPADSPQSTEDGSATPTPPPLTRCSASDMEDLVVDQQQLPPEVAATRVRIIELALACDYKGLQELADPNEFTFSYGVERSPAHFWRMLERQGEPVMAELVTLLNLRPNRSPRFELYGWPRAVRARATARDWQVVVDAGLVTQRQADDARKFNLGYLDRRTFITFDGRWTAFVAGD